MKKLVMKILNAFIRKPYLNIKFYRKANNLSNKRKIVFMLTPEFGNIGDHAIYYAQKNFFQDNYPQYELLEVTYRESVNCFRQVERLVNYEDVIILNGGGNIGDTYLAIGKERKKIIRTFNKNKIISMPQSIFFTDTETGRKELENAKTPLSQENITLLCRDEKSFKFALENFDNDKTFLLPDTVLYWSYDYYKKISEREHKALVLFRNDKEKNITRSSKEQVLAKLKEKKINYTLSDTHVNESLVGEDRLKQVKLKIDQVRNCRFVVTDRYHGVVFSIITKTPCIVFKSKDHKIEEGIKWFKKHNFLFYLGSDPSKIDEAIEQIYTITDENLTAPEFKSKFVKFFKEKRIIPN